MRWYGAYLRIVDCRDTAQGSKADGEERPTNKLHRVLCMAQ